MKARYTILILFSMLFMSAAMSAGGVLGATERSGAVVRALFKDETDSRDLDSLTKKALVEKMEEYVKAIVPLDIERQKEECDFLIGECRDSLIKGFVAQWLYSHYVSSKIMGVEAVAVHLYDNWFAPGKVSFDSPLQKIDANIYAEFNRQSLVGKIAPEISMQVISGEVRSLFGEQNNPKPRYSVVFFYDTSCPNCTIQSILLRNLLQDFDYELDFYAIYTGSDKEAWGKYIDERLSINSSKVRVMHYWDPDAESDFQKKYGVLKTPSLFLIDKNMRIVGRKLDAAALSAMLDHIVSAENYVYGSDESELFFAQLFSTMEEDFSVKDVCLVADRIAERTSSASLSCKHMLGDLFMYLSKQRDGRYKEGCKYLVDKYIIGRNDLWDTSSDSVAVVGFAEIQSELLSRALPGSDVPEFLLKGSLNGRKVVRRLDRLPKGTYVIFHTLGCPNCAEQLEAAELLAVKMRENGLKFRIFEVELSENENVVLKKGEKLQDKFDLLYLPFVFQIGPKGKVDSRYVDLVRLAGR